MCGIVGIVTDFKNGFAAKELDTFKDLLYVDALRGEDSTGIVSFYNNGEMEIAKEASEAAFFAYTAEYKKIMTTCWSYGKALIGHNRKKTVGSINDETAHPFVIDDRYAFVHNGTLKGHKHLADTEVDSEALGTVLARCEGDVTKMAEVLAKVDGAYATAWVDQEKEVLYLMRNDERELNIAETESGFIFASELGMLLAMASRNRLKIKEPGPVEPHTLYSINLDGSPVVLKKEKFEVKKSMPPMHIKGAMTNGGQSKLGNKEQVSKNESKRQKRSLVGKYVTFYAEDYSPRFPAEPDSGQWVVYGESDELPRNFIKGFYGEFSEGFVKNSMGFLFHGKVVQVEYNKQAGGALDIVVTDIKQVPRSFSSFSKEGYEEAKNHLH